MKNIFRMNQGSVGQVIPPDEEGGGETFFIGQVSGKKGSFGAGSLGKNHGEIVTKLPLCLRGLLTI